MGAATKKRGVLQAIIETAGLATGVVLLIAVIVTPLELGSQAVFAGATMVLALVVARSHGHLAGLVLAFVSMATSGRYMFWRVTSTLPGAEQPLEAVISVVLLLAELYAFAMLLLGYVQSLGGLQRKPVPLPANTSAWPAVDVFIPTFNEPLEVVRTTVLAACALDWPADKLRVHLLDDGRRDEFRRFAAEAGIHYVRRADNQYAKAGNLNNALARSSGDFVAIFDCDHVPVRSFLQTTMGWFLRDPRLALVQTPHHFYSPDPFERNLGTWRRVPNEGELFYGLLLKGSDLWNSAFFCGSCAVLRRSALQEIGGIAVETVTEDAHTALRMHRRGWKSAYIAVPQAAGLATESLSAHVGQRIRWARGMAQIFRIDNPFLGRGLTLAQRLCYAASMLHFFSGLPRLLFLLAPLAYLLFGIHVFNATTAAALAYALPHLAHAIGTSSRLQGGVRHSFWSEVYETCLAFYIAIPTTVAMLSPRKGRFNVTAKGGCIAETRFDRTITRPHLVLAALCLAGAGAGAWRLYAGAGELDVAAVNLFWTLHNLVLLGVTLAVGLEQRQVREAPRVEVALPAMLALATGRTVRCRTVDLARGGAQLTLSGDRAFAPGETLWVTLFASGPEQPLPARVVSQEGRSLRVRFDELSLEEERALVEALFCRADAWVRWKDGRPADAPFESLRSIARHAVRGFVAAAASLLQGRPAEPAPVPSGLLRGAP